MDVGHDAPVGYIVNTQTNHIPTSTTDPSATNRWLTQPTAHCAAHRLHCMHRLALRIILSRLLAYACLLALALMPLCHYALIYIKNARTYMHRLTIQCNGRRNP